MQRQLRALASGIRLPDVEFHFCHLSAVCPGASVSTFLFQFSFSVGDNINPYLIWLLGRLGVISSKALSTILVYGKHRHKAASMWNFGGSVSQGQELEGAGYFLALEPEDLLGIPPLPLTDCRDLGRLIQCSELRFVICEKATDTPQGCWEVSLGLMAHSLCWAYD